MVATGPTSALLPSSSMLAALSQAFSYPWNGIGETLEGLRALGDGAPEGPQQPDDGALAGLQQPDDGACGAFADSVRNLLEAATCFESRTAERLAYTRLFIGSFKMEAPPYASYYLEEARTLNGRAAVEVASIYRQFGIELDPKEAAPADHLRYLLAFLALMARRYEETGEAALAEAYADFRDDYVLSWIDAFKALVERNAEAPYYPALVELVVDVLKWHRTARAVANA